MNPGNTHAEQIAAARAGVLKGDEASPLNRAERRAAKHGQKRRQKRKVRR